jgi:hypothetical protein
VHFTRYLERGFSVIPVYLKGKNPAIAAWQEFCERLPTPDQAALWDRGNYNIGLACGPASGVVALDIDSDDKSILNACPQSPVVRRGAKGEVRFFKWRPDITSQSIPQIDILSAGRQVVLPPSIHPSGTQYTWISPDTLETIDKDDLPDLDLSFLAHVSKRVHIAPTGRNNKLVDIVTSMRSRGESERAIVDEVYNWDLRFHTPRLFTDHSEGYRAKDENEARTNAWEFVSNVTRSLIRSGVASLGEESQVVIIDDTLPAAPVYRALEFPRPTGVMGSIMSLTEQFSEREMPNLALGGAVALMSAICSNRFRFGDTWTNTYVLNLAPTGAGKSFPQRVIQRIEDGMGLGLIGFGNYRSSSALTKNLVSRRERLDLIDEMASLFNQMRSGGVYQVEILDELCKLWSSSSGRFLAGEYAEREDTASCYNPCVSILGSSTIEGVKSAISAEMVQKGLLPRFLIFSHDTYGKIKDDRWDQSLFNSILDELREIKKFDKRKSKADVDLKRGPMYDPYDIFPKDKSAAKYFRDIKMEFAESLESDMPESIKQMMTRGKEQVMKLAAIHAASNHRYGGAILEDITWAKSVFDVSLHNSRSLIEESSARTPYEKELLRIESIIEKKGPIAKGKIYNAARSMPKRTIDELLNHLTSIGRVEQVISAHSANGTRYESYRIKKS